MIIEISDLKLKIDQLELLVSEEKNSNDLLKNKVEGQKKLIEEVKKLSESKNSVIESLKNHLITFEEKSKCWKEEKENFEYKICELASGMRMKDDEMETIVMLLESILSKNKRKFDNHINRIDENITNNIMKLVKDYKIFK
jgi:predicted Rossmann fold nucleotide-binding protein DprA/Smf involved in DNA uptake